MVHYPIEDAIRLSKCWEIGDWGYSRLNPKFRSRRARLRERGQRVHSARNSVSLEQILIKGMPCNACRSDDVSQGVFNRNFQEICQKSNRNIKRWRDRLKKENSLLDRESTWVSLTLISVRSAPKSKRSHGRAPPLSRIPSYSLYCAVNTPINRAPVPPGLVVFVIFQNVKKHDIPSSSKAPQ